MSTPAPTSASASAGSPPSSSGGDAPPPEILMVVYVVLGSILSFLVGHEPGTLPENLIAEVCPSIVVICVFLSTYSAYDVLICGTTKQKYGYTSANYSDFPSRLPEEAFLAERAQLNQVEQLPSFLTSTICFSTLVNGKVGAMLALIWAILRRLYSSKYRHSAGIPLGKKGLALYTVPCYFILNMMLMGSAVHALRWTMVASA